MSKKPSSNTSSDDKPSKSELRRQARDKLVLAQKLVELDLTRTADLTLPENIHDAVIATQQIRSNIARKRQLHYLAKLLRNMDTSAISAYFTTQNVRDRNKTERFHYIEKIRDRLINEGPSALNEILEQHDMLEQNRIRDILNSASGSQVARKKAARSLFRYLKDTIDPDI